MRSHKGEQPDHREDVVEVALTKWQFLAFIPKAVCCPKPCHLQKKLAGGCCSEEKVPVNNWRS
jgi:hypothetical protein